MLPPDDNNLWSDPYRNPGSSPDEELPEDVRDEPAPVYEVVATVVCWRCDYRDVPDRGRCQKCRARIAEEDEDRWVRRRSRSDTDPHANRIGSVVLYFSLFLLVSVVWGWILLSGAHRMTEDDVLRGTAVLEVIDTVLVLLALAAVGRKPLADVTSGARMTVWLLGAPVLLALIGCNHLYAEILRDFLRQNGLQPPTMPLNGITIVLICVQPAIVEELFFRYVAFGALSRATGLHSTVFVTGVMFAVAHIYNPLGMPYLFVAGVVFGYARAWGGLALPMVMHFFHNLAVLAMEGV